SGLRIIGRSRGDKLHTNWEVVGARSHARIELYCDADRYITITGLQVGDCSELTSIDELLDDLDKSRPGSKQTNGDAVLSGNGHDAGLFDTDDLIENGAPPGQRSEAFARAVWSMAGTGCTADEIEAELRAYPNGIAAKYLKPDRLRKEIERCLDKRPSGQSGDDRPKARSTRAPSHDWDDPDFSVLEDRR